MSQYLTDADVTKRTMDTLTVLKALAEAEARATKAEARVRDLEGVIVVAHKMQVCHGFSMTLSDSASAILTRKKEPDLRG